MYINIEEIGSFRSFNPKKESDCPTTPNPITVTRLSKNNPILEQNQISVD